MHLTFHHTAFRIRKGSLDAVERLFRRLGFETFERSVTARDAAIWMGPKGSSAVVQFNEVDASPLAIEQKTYSHLAFLDSDPKAATDDLARWLKEQGIASRIGQWSDRELWLDCPDLFLDFVIEIMHPFVAGEKEQAVV